MAGVYEPSEHRQAGEIGIDGDGAAEVGGETAELIAQIRQLAAHDPVGVQQVVADVLAALNRATGGAFDDQLPEGAPFVGDEYGEPPVRLTELEVATTEQRTADTG